MKASKKQKPHGIKQKIHEEKKREQRITLVVTVAVLIIIIFISGFLFNSMFSQSPTNQTTNSTSKPKAAIVDHLSLTEPNQTFIQSAKKILTQAGFTVSYYPGEEVDVEFYKNLPTYGHSLIILRAHSALTFQSGSFQNSLGIFTSEVQSRTKYVYEQLTDQLVGAKFPYDETIYFGISHLFVSNSMKGTFRNATIIHMGCDGMAADSMAKAFRQKGAKAYIGWTGDVLADHTDQATTHLLRHLITKRETVREAITHTMKEVGPDPVHNSVLQSYPSETEDYAISNP